MNLFKAEIMASLLCVLHGTFNINSYTTGPLVLRGHVMQAWDLALSAKASSDQSL